MKKRDRMVEAYINRSKGMLLLFPNVFYMVGVYAPAGEPCELPHDTSESKIGEAVIKLLHGAKKADVEGLATRRMNRLRAYWKGQGATEGDEDQQGTHWRQLLQKYPSLAKGSGTFIRQFHVGQILEREGTKSWRLTVLEPAPTRGLRFGREWQVKFADGARALGEAVRQLSIID